MNKKNSKSLKKLSIARTTLLWSAIAAMFLCASAALAIQCFCYQIPSIPAGDVSGTTTTQCSPTITFCDQYVAPAGYAFSCVDSESGFNECCCASGTMTAQDWPGICGGNTCYLNGTWSWVNLTANYCYTPNNPDCPH